MSVPISADKTTIHLRVSGNFGIAYPFAAPADGAASSNLKMISEQWNDAHDQLQLQVAGVNGKTYEVPIFNAPSGIAVKGAKIMKPPSGLALEIAFPGNPPSSPDSGRRVGSAATSGAFTTRTVTLQFPSR